MVQHVKEHHCDGDIFEYALKPETMLKCISIIVNFIILNSEQCIGLVVCKLEGKYLAVKNLNNNFPIY